MKYGWKPVVGVRKKMLQAEKTANAGSQHGGRIHDQRTDQRTENCRQFDRAAAKGMRRRKGKGKGGPRGGQGLCTRGRVVTTQVEGT